MTKTLTGRDEAAVTLVARILRNIAPAKWPEYPEYQRRAVVKELIPTLEDQRFEDAVHAQYVVVQTLDLISRIPVDETVEDFYPSDRAARRDLALITALLGEIVTAPGKDLLRCDVQLMDQSLPEAPEIGSLGFYLPRTNCARSWAAHSAQTVVDFLLSPMARQREVFDPSMVDSQSWLEEILDGMIQRSDRLNGSIAWRARRGDW